MAARNIFAIHEINSVICLSASCLEHGHRYHPSRRWLLMVDGICEREVWTVASSFRNHGRTMTSRPSFSLVSVCLMIAPLLQMAASEPPSMPMSWNPENSIRHRWLSKPVLETRLLDSMESPDSWEHHGIGTAVELGQHGFKMVRGRAA